MFFYARRLAQAGLRYDWRSPLDKELSTFIYLSILNIRFANDLKIKKKMDAKLVQEHISSFYIQLRIKTCSKACGGNCGGISTKKKLDFPGQKENRHKKSRTFPLFYSSVNG